MHERLVELLVMLLGRLGSERRSDAIDVTGLSGHGYSDSEISTAVAWLFDRMQAGPSARPADLPARSLRVLHSVERSVLRPDAYGFLLQCHHLGLLSADELETVIERVMMSGVPVVGEQEVKALVAGVLFESDRGSDGTTPLLGPTDTIH